MAGQMIDVKVVRERACCAKTARQKAYDHETHPSCLGAICWDFRGEYGVRAIYPLTWAEGVETTCWLEIPKDSRAPRR